MKIYSLETMQQNPRRKDAADTDQSSMIDSNHNCTHNQPTSTDSTYTYNTYIPAHPASYPHTSPIDLPFRNIIASHTSAFPCSSHFILALLLSPSSLISSSVFYYNFYFNYFIIIIIIIFIIFIIIITFLHFLHFFSTSLTRFSLFYVYFGPLSQFKYLVLLLQFVWHVCCLHILCLSYLM